MDDRIIILLLGLLTVAMIMGMCWMKSATDYMRAEIRKLEEQSEGEDEP